MPRGLAHDSAFWRRLAYAGARFGPEFWLKYTPPIFGVAFALALGEKRQKVEDTLRWVRGPTDPAREWRESLETFVHYAQCLAEALAAERPSAANARYTVHGDEHLKATFAGDGGLLVVTAHVGPWDAAARMLLASSGRSVAVVMQQEPDRRARALHDEIRERSGIKIIHVGEHALDALPLLRHLNRGGVIALQLDRQSPSGRTLPVQLFGRQIQVPEGPFRLAKLASVPVLPLFTRRLGQFNYEIVVYPPIRLERGADHGELQNAAQRAVDDMAAFIFTCPTQWFNF